MKERLQKADFTGRHCFTPRCRELIRQGQVTVNGEIVRELGTKADPQSDHIKVRGKLINPKLTAREKIYILLNKPKGVISCVSDPEGRKKVTDLVQGYGKLYPVGRLDFNSEGLIILTNDGDLTNRLTAAKTVPKTYYVKVKGVPSDVAIRKLARGIRLPDGFKTAPAEIRQLKLTDKNAWYEVVLYEGHNQQIRKMFDSIGHSVVKLKRVSIGGLTDSGLPPGKFRLLSDKDLRQIFSSLPRLSN